MNQAKSNPFKDLKLTKEEKEIEKAIEAGNYEEADNLAELKRVYQVYAKNTLSKLKNINIRLSTRDIEKLKTKAAENGMPYQTLAATLIRQYSNGRIKVTL